MNDEPRDQALTDKRVLIVHGDSDPMTTPEQTSRLTEQFCHRDADVGLMPFPGGHTIDAGALPQIKKFIDMGRPT